MLKQVKVLGLSIVIGLGMNLVGCVDTQDTNVEENNIHVEQSKNTTQENKSTEKKEVKEESKKETKQNKVQKQQKEEMGQCYDCGEYKPVKNMVYNGRSYHCGCINVECDNCRNEVPYNTLHIDVDNQVYLCPNCCKGFENSPHFCPDCFGPVYKGHENVVDGGYIICDMCYDAYMQELNGFEEEGNNYEEEQDNEEYPNSYLENQGEYVDCDECGKTIKTSEACEVDGYLYCQDCYDAGAGTYVCPECGARVYYGTQCECGAEY